MKEYFRAKTEYQTSEINERVADGFVKSCEDEYASRVRSLVDTIIERKSRIVMISGPSASGKTTSSYRIAGEFSNRGHRAVVISLDDFFKNIDNYPQTEDGKPDMENVGALDLDHIRKCLEQLVQDGRSILPTFDFVNQCRSPKTQLVELSEGDIAIIEGIHALNPLLSETIPQNSVFKIYVGLRAEYYEGDKRILATRDLRITRRLVRDFKFRGHSVRNTLEMWERIMEGEEQWIKPFKKDADKLLDSSFAYEPCVFRRVLESLSTDQEQGGEFRPLLLSLVRKFSYFEPIDENTVPKNSVLREFFGGLEL